MLYRAALNLNRKKGHFMKNTFLFLAIVAGITSSCSQKDYPDDLIFVKGGHFKNKNSDLYKKNLRLADFYIGKYEVTQKEWTEIMGSNPSNFKGDNLPVEMVNWYDCIEYCNARSIREGLDPFYNINKDKDPDNKSIIDSIKWTVTINPDANGYRLPTEAEWEYAAAGGKVSKGYLYSGSDDIDEVAWYWRNSGEKILEGSWIWPAIENNKCRTKPVGLKAPNELGLFDMSGNVREWCQDWYADNNIDSGFVRVQRGGGWIGSDKRCESLNRHSFEASGKGADQGFRICRTAL